MKRDKIVKSAEFSYGDSLGSIDIVLSRLSWPLRLFENHIEHGARVLSEIELETVISILAKDKEAMSKQRDCPQIYSEMLSDLIEVQTGRYGVKNGKEKTDSEGITSKIDEDALYTLCDMCDEEAGPYPENVYEGGAVYRFYRKLSAEEIECIRLCKIYRRKCYFRYST